jgi:hypothetical protein
MKTICFLLALMTAPLAAAEPEFTSLFNGKNLDGWKVVNGRGEYRAENGCIVGHGENLRRNTFLRTEKTYADFDFRFEMKFDNLRGNSGVQFRSQQKPGDDGRVFGYQCEHDNKKKRAWTAGLYDEARRGWLVPDRDDKEAAAAFTERGRELFRWDDWNDIRIVCEGRRIRIWLNGEQTVDFTDDGEAFTPEGFFGLQVHSGKSCRVRWRHLRVKPL